jgi:hypothetical protein
MGDSEGGSCEVRWIGANLGAGEWDPLVSLV